MSAWGRLVGGRRIVTRLVVAVVLSMGVVLLLGSSFVYWRVSFALDRQVDQDLAAWRSVAVRAVAGGTTPPTDAPGVGVQVYDLDGRLLSGTAGRSDLGPVVSPAEVRAAASGPARRLDTGRLLPAELPAYRVQVERVQTEAGPRVVASLISRSKRDEALRELLLQLALADLLALAAAGLVGHRTARAALDPVEAYRRAAASAEPETRLPVAEDREDELTRLGHTLNDLLDRLAVSAERERQFLADASHELRSPLALMRTELEWARHRRRTPEELDAVLASLAGQVERLVGLANALLELEEVRAAGELVREEVALRDLVAEAVRDAGLAGAEPPVEQDVPDEVVHLDRRWVRIALANLLANAERHGDGRVSVGAERLAGDLLRLVVRDQGPGFEESFRDVAFQRFRRAEASRTTPGSGLGLALVRSVAQAHGGEARIVGGPGGAVELLLPSGPDGGPDVDPGVSPGRR